MNSFNKILLAVGFAAAAAVTVQAQEGKPRPVAPSDMVNNVAAFETQIEADSKRIQHLQTIARKAKDVVKLTCVNDKIVELKAERNVFDVNKKTFDAALQANAENARTPYNDLSKSAETISRVRGEAEECIGVPELYKQESDVEVTHPDFPDDPTIDDPFGPDVEPPAYASPY
jgi:hypothetical protein